MKIKVELTWTVDTGEVSWWAQVYLYKHGSMLKLSHLRLINVLSCESAALFIFSAHYADFILRFH